MSVEGVSKSSIARIMGISWNTAARWEEKAAEAARVFNENMTKGYELTELQADEIRTFSGVKDEPTWVFASMAVWSRLWDNQSFRTLPTRHEPTFDFRVTQPLLRDGW